MLLKVASWSVGAVLLAGAVVARPAIAQEADVIAPHSEPGVIGRLRIGQAAEGGLAGLGQDEGSAFHTYTVEVPPGTGELTIKMTAAADLDLAVKHGTPIQEYGQSSDWDLGDNSRNSSATLRVKNPQPGTWYVDIINSLYTTEVVPYQLQID